jgi:hypothetical protein
MAPVRLCANHRDRPAFALCVTCRKALCQECATTWDGIHYCATCLTRHGQGPRSRTPWLTWVAVCLAAAALWYASRQLLLWVGVFLAELRS